MTQLQHESRPFLKSLRISFDLAVQVNIANLGPHVVQRFLFLEKLHITSSARFDDLTAFSGREDLSLTVLTVANQSPNMADLTLEHISDEG